MIKTNCLVLNLDVLFFIHEYILLQWLIAEYNIWFIYRLIFSFVLIVHLKSKYE